MADFAETEESFEGGRLMFDSEVEDWRSYGYKGCTVHQDLQFVELGLVIERANDCGSIKKHQ